ncbi:MAG: thioesterase family protein [Chitinophagaceae bacterium]|nr:thioesterase family protein [Chitinophagaceae bacterium]MBP9103574.1 thioesterase family protein [Chitinophagaceae bacterium]
MEDLVMPIQIRWSDLDPNFHLRHSVYYDWGAVCRVEYLNKAGLTLQRMQQLQIGLILFREECVFRREVRMGDVVTIDAKILKARRDFSRFTILHEIKKDTETVASIITVDIAWMSAVTRKLAALPEEDTKLLMQGPFAENFQWED